MNGGCNICHGLGWIPAWGPVETEDVGLLLMLEDFYDLMGEPIEKTPCHCEDDTDNEDAD